MPTPTSSHLRSPIARADDGGPAAGASAPAAPISKTVTTIAAAGIVTVQALEGTYRRQLPSGTWSFDSADGRHHVDVVTAAPTLVWLQAEAALVIPAVAHQHHLQLLIGADS